MNCCQIKQSLQVKSTTANLQRESYQLKVLFIQILGTLLYVEIFFFSENSNLWTMKSQNKKEPLNFLIITLSYLKRLPRSVFHKMECGISLRYYFICLFVCLFATNKYHSLCISNMYNKHRLYDYLFGIPTKQYIVMITL